MNSAFRSGSKPWKKICVLGITEFHKTADEFISVVEALSKHVEQEKIKALGSSNLLKSMAKQREAQQQQYQVLTRYLKMWWTFSWLIFFSQSLIIEKSTELERLQVQHQSLLRIEAEQQETIDQIQLYWKTRGITRINFPKEIL